jgi:Zn-dependent alcohol dehydrogenase
MALVPKMGLDIVVEEVELDDPGDYEVRLKVMTCTVCNSDVLAWTGEHGEYEGPGGAGHEIAGVVDAVGSKVQYVKPGDRVLCSEVRAGCGHCVQCLNDRPWFCENNPPMSFRLPSAHSRLNGERIIQTCSGANGFAEYCNAYEGMLCKLDDDIPFEIGSALACGFMSGFGAVLNRVKPRPTESFAVIGCGGVGLSAVMGARYCGAIPIIGIDTQDIKLEAAKKFGATHIINPKTEDVVARVKEITGGPGADHVFVAAAGKGIKRTAVDISADYGQVVVVGHGHWRDEYLSDFNWFELLAGRRLTGCVMGNLMLRRDIPKYMDMYRRGLVNIDALLTHRFTLDRIKDAIDDSLAGALKNVVYIGAEIPADKLDTVPPRNA